MEKDTFEGNAVFEIPCGEAEHEASSKDTVIQVRNVIAFFKPRLLDISVLKHIVVRRVPDPVAFKVDKTVYRT